MSNNHRIPIYQITADNQPLNALINSRIISISITDNRSGEADELSLSLSDHDGQLQLPKRGVKLTCKLGFIDSGLHDMGSFIVDQTEWQGTPDTITIKARSADFKSPLKTGKRKSYHRQTFGQIAQSIATENKLKLVINPDLAKLNHAHIDQTDESDLNLLGRLAKQNGAELSIKQGRLLIFKAAQAKTASGQTLPTLSLTRQDGDQFSYQEQDRESDYSGVSASYQDPKAAKHQRVTSGNPEIRGGGDDPNTKTKLLKGTYANAEEAQRAADAEQQRINRAKATFSITTAHGRPDISTESPVQLQGFKKEIDQLKWIVAKATHNYSSNGGLTTALELEANI